MIKIGFDIGGVLSKYPKVFKPIIDTLIEDHEIHIISDMHPIEKINWMLFLNNLNHPKLTVHSADYATYGENCKSVLLKELNLDLFIDDHMGYLMNISTDCVRLMVMPNPNLPYYDDAWKTDGSEGDFGRRKVPKCS